jgi:hypothetical protein
MPIPTAGYSKKMLKLLDIYYESGMWTKYNWYDFLEKLVEICRNKSEEVVLMRLVSLFASSPKRPSRNASKIHKQVININEYEIKRFCRKIEKN